MIRFTGILLGIVVSSIVFAQEHIVKVTMATSMGNIEIDLYADKAPTTVSNFLQLIDGNHLDGGTFYRVVNYANDNGSPKIEVIQGGRGDEEGPFPPIEHETTEQTGILHKDGVISMARDNVGTATSEFFICIGNQPGLDYGGARHPDEQGFAAFGVVVGGMDVVKKINQAPADAPSESEFTRGQFLVEPVRINTVRRSGK